MLLGINRIPIGSASVLELPAGMIDPGTGTVAGVAAKEMKEECGITVKESDLIDLTKLAHADAEDKTVPIGIAPSPGGCDEYIRIMYMERTVHQSELDAMNNRLAGLREEGEAITLRVVPYDNMWKLTPDAKAMWYVIAIILDIMCWWC
jgi:ADP-sugar diphosphatase